MSTEITVSVISAAVAVGSVGVSTWAAFKSARLNQEFQLAQAAASKEQLVEEVMSKYREPLARAAFDLQSRIYNIIKNRFLIRYGAEGREHEQVYARESTLFVFAEYFGWVEILRRDVQFLDLGDVGRNRALVERLEAIGDAFASDRKVLDPSFRIFRGEQRALGELMIPTPEDTESAARRACIGYAHFRGRLRQDPEFAAWFRPLDEDVAALTKDGDHSYERLTKLQHALVDLILFLDDPPTRFLPENCQKL